MDAIKIFWMGFWIMVIGGTIALILGSLLMVLIITPNTAESGLKIGFIITTIGMILFGGSIPFCKINPLIEH